MRKFHDVIYSEMLFAGENYCFLGAHGANLTLTINIKYETFYESNDVYSASNDKKYETRGKTEIVCC